VASTGAQTSYGQEQATRWLSWLARGMQDHGQTIFLIEQLQPSWLKERGQRWLYALISRVLAGVLLAGAFALPAGLEAMTWAPALGFGFGLVAAAVEGWRWRRGGDPGDAKGEPGRWQLALLVLVLGLILGPAILAMVTLFGGFFEASGRAASSPRLTFAVLVALAVGVLSGEIVRLVVRLGRSQHGEERSSAGRWSAAVVLGLVLAFELVGVGLEVRDAGWLSPALAKVLLVALLSGLGAALIWGLRRRGQRSSSDIQAVETLAWSWPGARRGVLVGLKFGLIAAAVIGSVLGLVLLLRLLAEPGVARDGSIAQQVLLLLLIVLLFAGEALLLAALLGGVFGAFRHRPRELKTAPNQGIRLSLRNALSVGPAVLVILTPILSGSLLVLGEPAALWQGLAAGLAFALLAGLWHGGLDALHHYVLRFILYRQGSLPWDVASFLDYAAEDLGFLQKVGGGYMFLHRYLLEHFAAMEEEPEPTRAREQSAPVQASG
jgi:hypothetical protein